MSPRTRVGRDDWVTAMLEMMDQGRVPEDVSLTELAETLGMTKGSFYSAEHFGNGKLAALYAAVIDVWKRDRIAALPGAMVGAVREPLDKIRMVWTAAAGSAVRNAVMARWAASNEAAAKAVAEVDRLVVSHLEPAMADLGFTGPEPAALSRLLAAALREGVPGTPEDGETVLRVLDRASADPQDGPGTGGVTARDLTRDERKALERVARLMAANRTGESPSARARSEAGEV